MCSPGRSYRILIWFLLFQRLIAIHFFGGVVLSDVLMLVFGGLGDEMKDKNEPFVGVEQKEEEKGRGGGQENEI